jgi:hypothetical protein
MAMGDQDTKEMTSAFDDPFLKAMILVVARVDQKRRIPVFEQIGIRVSAMKGNHFDIHKDILVLIALFWQRKKRQSPLVFLFLSEEGLLLFLVESLLPTVPAELKDFHFVRMVPFVAGGDVVFVPAFGALQDDLIAFAGHFCNTSFFSR